LALRSPNLLRANFNPGSFLVSLFEKSSLATAIAYYFEKKVEGSPDGAKIRAAPSLEGIRGTLQAEDQTSAFDWRKYVVAVDTVLELTESNMSRNRNHTPPMQLVANSSISFETLPSSIFRGLVNMLPLVQHFAAPQSPSTTIAIHHNRHPPQSPSAIIAFTTIAIHYHPSSQLTTTPVTAASKTAPITATLH
jgi:hypothetical protein